MEMPYLSFLRGSYFLSFRPIPIILADYQKGPKYNNDLHQKLLFNLIKKYILKISVQYLHCMLHYLLEFTSLFPNFSCNNENTSGATLSILVGFQSRSTHICLVFPFVRSFPCGSIVCLLSEFVEDESPRSEEHTSELQSRGHLVCRLLLEKKKTFT